MLWLLNGSELVRAWYVFKTDYGGAERSNQQQNGNPPEPLFQRIP